jgi:hypothetical protein
MLGSLTSRSLFSLIVGLLIVAVAYDFRTVGCLNGLDRMNEDRERDEAMDDDRVKWIREEVLRARNMRILETCGHSRPYNLEVIISRSLELTSSRPPWHSFLRQHEAKTPKCRANLDLNFSRLQSYSAETKISSFAPRRPF